MAAVSDYRIEADTAIEQGGRYDGIQRLPFIPAVRRVSG